jgi:hypothetical protein
MPDGLATPILQDRRTALLLVLTSAFRCKVEHPYVQCAEAWIAFIDPAKAPGSVADPELLATHTALVGFDDAYWRGLLKAFAALRMGDLDR